MIEKIMTVALTIMCTFGINTNSFAQTAIYNPQTGKTTTVPCQQSGGRMICPEVAISRPIPMQSSQPATPSSAPASIPTRIGTVVMPKSNIPTQAGRPFQPAPTAMNNNQQMLEMKRDNRFNNQQTGVTNSQLNQRMMNDQQNSIMKAH